MEDCGPMVGIPAVSGRIPFRAVSFSEVIWRALYISVPQLNSTQTTENPVVEDERTRLTSVAPFTAVSTGNVTKRSTSSGAIPGASVMTTTVGALRSGNTSTSIFIAVNVPANKRIMDAINISRRLFRE
ncbi:unknown [Tannerella sp. CAG:118]|nr:unknown [Tannerella sp. CAG:118]